MDDLKLGLRLEKLEATALVDGGVGRLEIKRRQKKKSKEKKRKEKRRGRKVLVKYTLQT